MGYEHGKEICKIFERHTSSVNFVAFSPDSKCIASGSSDGVIFEWATETGHMVSGLFERHTDTIISVMFSPDGKSIVSGSWDHTARIWGGDV